MPTLTLVRAHTCHPGPLCAEWYPGNLTAGCGHGSCQTMMADECARCLVEITARLALPEGR